MTDLTPPQLETTKLKTKLSHVELAQKIYKACHLTGNFKLRSGQTSHEYFDKYRFEAKPELLWEVALHMKSLIPQDTEVLAGLEMGGIPVATALSLVTGLPVAFIRKEAKNYGTCLFAEGVNLQNKKICIIEDVITSGGQVILSAQDLKSLNCTILKVLCVINRGGLDAEQKLLEKGLSMSSVFLRSDFP